MSVTMDALPDCHEVDALRDYLQMWATSQRECINTSAAVATVARHMGLRATLMATDTRAVRVDSVPSTATVTHERPFHLHGWAGHMVALLTVQSTTYLVDATVEQFAPWTGTPTWESREWLAQPAPRGWRTGGTPWTVRPASTWLRSITYTAVPELGDDPVDGDTWRRARELVGV